MTRLDDVRDSHNDRDVRAVLEALDQLLQETHATCIGVIHLNKSTGAVENRIMGSRAWSAVARSQVCIVLDTENEQQRFVTHLKCNYGPKQQSLKFGFKNVTVGDDEGEPIMASQIVELGASDLTASEAMAAMDNRHLNKAETPADMASAWLIAFFDANTDKQLELDSNGNGKAQGILRETIVAAAKKARHSERTVNRVANDLGVVKTQVGRKTLWSLAVL